MTLEEGYFVIERKWYAAMKAEKNCVDDEVAKEVYQMQKKNYFNNWKHSQTVFFLLISC